MALVRTAEIIAVGTEMLTPHRIDTNSLFLTGQLNELGIEVRAKAIVRDDRAELATILRGALARVDLVITTGGLGPTADDVTKEAVAEVLGRPLDEDAAILAAIRARFDRRGVRMPEINRRQAQVPRGARVLPNPNGTAPGLLLDADDRLVVLLPGPPRELKPMFEAELRSWLEQRTGGRRVLRRAIKTTGRSESQVEEITHPIYSALGDEEVEITTTILATPGQIELNLSAAGADVDRLGRRLDEGVAALVAALGPCVFSTDGRTLEAVVGEALRRRGWRIGAAESCTGGTLLGRLTEVPGSSAWVVGGIVAYANDVKVAQLGVPRTLIDAHGAVSEPVARAMASGVIAALGVDVGVAITGVAGPAGGTAEKPVGTVVVALATSAGGDPLARTHAFPGDRDAIRRHATSAALEMVRQSLQQA
ncbi:MAG: competence/damage-inducible protein A [Acidobacteria bacterium]|nr:competence/damage-inducible protein A [Acidobacteriota bacterium]